MTKIDIDRLRKAVRDVPDFPKPGIIFKDITPVLLDPELFGMATEAMAAAFAGAGVTRVVAVESRGFLFGAPIALRLAAGLVPGRQPGGLPSPRPPRPHELGDVADALEVDA